MREQFLKSFLEFLFFTDEINSLEDIELPEDITNQFRKVRMAYYQIKTKHQYLSKQ